ncbi:Uncharacterized membrane protein YcaP, DUF421 family [Bacillus sp. OV322]|uniref:DUF421 domain-containing protein n=1 Tax=Bacillus sp. OV322 TaxID=1882764 RepID=UPI0008E1572E|nr:DUF421 domain-containing protein [Bacillus sp. OV322]SFC53595.1 Uncharacterized membrane protein YcaP, DUF421 family [Bacillus sp. OV322]
MEYAGVIIRTLILYLVMMVIFRLMGKREIGELSILDLVVFIMIGEMAVLSIENPDIPIVKSILPMVLLMIIQIILALLSLKSQKFREVLDGKPSIIISQGKIDEHVMRKQRYNFDDLLSQLREKDILNIGEVEYAILEPSGQLSVIEKKQGEKQEKVSPFPLIIDGVIQEKSLSRLHKDEKWLLQQLNRQGYHSISQVSFCTCIDGKLYIDEQDSQ